MRKFILITFIASLTLIKVYGQDPSQIIVPSYNDKYTKDSDGGTLMSKIDGKEYWGTDGDMPKNEYESICVTIKRIMFYISKQ